MCLLFICSISRTTSGNRPRGLNIDLLGLSWLIHSFQMTPGAQCHVELRRIVWFCIGLWWPLTCWTDRKFLRMSQQFPSALYRLNAAFLRPLTQDAQPNVSRFPCWDSRGVGCSYGPATLIPASLEDPTWHEEGDAKGPTKHVHIFGISWANQQSNPCSMISTTQKPMVEDGRSIGFLSGAHIRGVQDQGWT